MHEGRLHTHVGAQALRSAFVHLVALRGGHKYLCPQGLALASACLAHGQVMQKFVALLWICAARHARQQLRRIDIGMISGASVQSWNEGSFGKGFFRKVHFPEILELLETL